MNHSVLNKLKAQAKPHASDDKALTLYMNPIKPIRHDWLVTELERIRPRVKWTHRDTGTVQYTMPDQVALERQRQRKMADPNPQDVGWDEQYLWSDLESSFVVLESYVLDIEVGDHLTPEQERLRAYWQGRTNVVADDFELFIYTFPASLFDFLWNAYTTTRPSTLAAPAALSDPKGDPANPDALPES